MEIRSILAVSFLLVAAVAPAAGAAGAGQQDCSFPFSETDATGTEVTVEEDPGSVVTLAPSAAQTMWEIGARDEVVGVSKYASYLEGASAKENVSGGGGTFVVVEKVVALEPDLVLAPNVIPNDTVAQLRNAGVTVFRFRAAGSIEDVYAKTTLVGHLTGECEGADRTVAGMKEEIATVREAVRGEDRPGALYVFFGFTASTGTFVHEIVETAGGTNVAAEAGVPPGYHQLSQEVVANRSGEIEWLLLNSDGPTVPDSPAYNATTAVREGNVIVLNANYISQPAPRIVRPITRLAKAFHPESYAEANATATRAPPTRIVTRTVEADTPTPRERTVVRTVVRTETSGQPGFGALLALLALLSVLVAARAR